MILRVENLVKIYGKGGGSASGASQGVRALDDVSIDVRRGESFGIVGESGSGKTTLTRCILGLEEITSGKIVYDGVDLATLSRAQMRSMRSRIQIVFQDPYASLNPRMTVHDIVGEPLLIHAKKVKLDRGQRTARVEELLEMVGLGRQHIHRYPHEFSGGQRQRIGIARALAVNPELLILDEPTSALDVSVQAQVLNLLIDLQRKLGLTYLFISHDLGVIRYVCDSVALIHRGKLVEEGDTEAIFERPRSEYARMLIDAMPVPDPDRSPFLMPS
ncbi:ABC transporter ATP-binding protein [Trinickia sp.]|uniref:ABC transporter ATP-binding protein n=1 Tax=Trinickia sp. TaxID=2571163 RepID=UPI003F7D1BD2